MGDLISRSALLEAMRKFEEDCEKDMTCPSWWSAYNVKEQPTAYDVEAVVAELEKKSKEYTKKAEEHEVYEDYCTRYYSIANGIDIAISIVRGKE